MVEYRWSMAVTSLSDMEAMRIQDIGDADSHSNIIASLVFSPNW